MTAKPRTPICPKCGYDLCTQVELQHPGYTNNGTPIEIRCDDCGQTSIWPRVTPSKAPRMTGVTKGDVRMFMLISIISAIVLLIYAIFSI